MRVYEKVKAYIADNKLKPKEVAQTAGIDARRFRAILGGRRRMYADELRAICCALNVQPEIFIDIV